MVKINSLDLSKCTNILDSDSPSYSGIVAGECKGGLWVDDIENPSLALVFSSAVGGFSIMGSSDNVSVYDDFVKFLRVKLFKELKSKGISYFEFSVESKKTEDYIMKLFSDKSMNQEDEYFYIKHEKNDIQDMQDYSIVQVDSELITRLQAGDYDNPKFLSQRLLESWGTYANFINKSVAFAATNETSIVGVIVGTARYQDKISVDIETKLEHRRKGISSKLTQYFVNECVSRGLIAHWVCVASNVASRRTVEKAGFTFVKKKPFYWFEI